MSTLDERFRQITLDSGRIVYINVLDIRSFYNFESKLLIEMIDGTVYTVNGAPAVAAFYASTFSLSPTDVNIVNSPVPTKEQLTPITLTSTVVSVTTSSTLVLAANPNRKFLSLRRGTTIGRMFIHFDASPATITNGDLMRENEYLMMPTANNEIYLGEINAITLTGSKFLYITEGS